MSRDRVSIGTIINAPGTKVRVEGVGADLCTVDVLSRALNGEPYNMMNVVSVMLPCGVVNPRQSPRHFIRRIQNESKRRTCDDCLSVEVMRGPSSHDR